MFPVTFDDCIGWLHPAVGRRGVVLCSAFGYDELCSRRTMHELAAAVAAAGLPVLRFDYHGTADSAGGGEDPERVATWIKNVGAATDLLRRECGVVEVTLVGLRLGALLAALAAGKRNDISRIALLAPPSSGRAYVRELQALSKLLVAPAEDAAMADGLEVAGFQVRQNTLDALSKLDWPEAPQPSPSILLMAPDHSPAKPLAGKLRSLGWGVDELPFQAYAKMMCDPTASVVPVAAIAQLAEWLAEGAPKGLAERVAQPRTPVLVGERYVETPAQIGENGRLVGIYCRALSGQQPRKAVIFLNAGAIYHIGWARMYVDMARELARTGVASLRLDLSGIGESEASSAGAPRLYSPVSGDVHAAIDWLEAHGASDVTVFGTCSGAYQAFHAAISDRRVKRLALVNQLCFVWSAAYAVQLEAWRRTKATEVAARQEAAEANVSPFSARGLFVRALPPAKRVVKFALRHATNLVVRSGSLLSGKNLVERWFDQLSKRGTRVLLVYAENDPGLDELERYMGPDGCRATALPGVTKRLIENADHSFTPIEARRRLREILQSFLQDSNAAVPSVAA